MTSPARPRVVSLFSGIGATELALADLGCETVAHSDIEPYALSVFGRRFPHSTPLGNVSEITDVPECEIMAGGFPCQDISNAGKRAGIGGERSGLWSEFARLIGLARPGIVLIENVAALLARGLHVVLADLMALGYAAEWDCIPAAAVGAPHLRDRIWIVAYREDEDVVREDRLERSLATLALPPVKWPRAGRMCQGAVYVREPLAPRRTKRLNPGSAWVGVQLDSRNGWWHARPVFPTPSAVSYGTNQGGAAGRVGPVRHSLESMARHGMWPTATARDWKDVGDLSRVPDSSLLPRRVFRVENGLWPTPRTTDANGAGRHGYGGPDLRTAVFERSPAGSLNPDWVEWLMGFPIGWTDLSAAPSWHGWNHEPRDVPRVTDRRDHRPARLKALGNAQVPQVMRWWAAPAVERLA